MSANARTVRVASEAAGICRVLEVDHDLAEAVPAPRRGQAIRECLARTVVVPSGPWQGLPDVPGEERVGLLVLGGLVLRRVGIMNRFGAELLGEGDLLRPWQGEAELAPLPVTTGWRVLAPARMAVLDGAFVSRMAHYPQLFNRLIGRVLERSRSLAVNVAIVHHARVDVRVHMMLWQLAGRWGRVGPDGVILPLRLTHQVLADLVAARRPTVTTALTDLARRGLIEPGKGGWLLVGQPPGELAELVPLIAERAAETQLPAEV